MRPTVTGRLSSTLTSTNDLRIRALDPLPAPATCSPSCRSARPQRDLVERQSRREVRDVLTGDGRPAARRSSARARSTTRPPRSTTPRRLARLARELVRRPRRRHAGVLREAAHHRRAGRASSTTRTWTGRFDVQPRPAPGPRGAARRARRRASRRRCEFLEPTSPQYIADAVTWGAIGARNAGEPGAPPARLGPVDARRLQERHRRRRPGRRRRLRHRRQRAHVLRRRRRGPRRRRRDHRQPGLPRDPARRPLGPQLLDRGPSPTRCAWSAPAGLAPQRLVVDASHGNSGKDHVRQAEVVREIAGRVAAGEPRHLRAS